jgi:hypothetical protein
MKEHGGFNMWFIRPKMEKNVPFPENKSCPQGHGESSGDKTSKTGK